MDRYQNEIEKKIAEDDLFKGAEVERSNPETIIVVTKEKWVYLIKEDMVKYLGYEENVLPPDLNDSNVEFNLSKDGWTNEDITVEIINKVSGFELEYSTDEKNWLKYTGPITMKTNGTIYARLNNAGEFPGISTHKDINIIDKAEPEGSLSFSAEETTLTVSVNAKDKPADSNYGCSGISEIWYSIDGGSTFPVKTTETSNTFTGLTGGKSYNVCVKVFDVAGNPCTLNSQGDEAKTKLVKYLVKNSVIINSNYTFVGRGGVSDGNKFYVCPVDDKYWNHGVYWHITGCSSIKNIIIDMGFEPDAGSYRTPVTAYLSSTHTATGQGGNPLSFPVFGSVRVREQGQTYGRATFSMEVKNPTDEAFFGFHFDTYNGMVTPEFRIYNIKLES